MTAWHTTRDRISGSSRIVFIFGSTPITIHVAGSNEADSNIFDLGIKELKHTKLQGDQAQKPGS